MPEENRHTGESKPDRTVLRFGAFRLLRSERLLFDGDRPMRVSSRAMDILLALVSSPVDIQPRRIDLTCLARHVRRGREPACGYFRAAPRTR